MRAVAGIAQKLGVPTRAKLTELLSAFAAQAMA